MQSLDCVALSEDLGFVNNLWTSVKLDFWNENPENEPVYNLAEGSIFAPVRNVRKRNAKHVGIFKPDAADSGLLYCLC